MSNQVVVGIFFPGLVHGIGHHLGKFGIGLERLMKTSFGKVSFVHPGDLVSETP